MLYLLPLESYKERYTHWWSNYFPEKLKKLNIPFEIIHGTSITETVKAGTVLDAAGTNFFKATQLKEIARLFQAGEIKNGDVFLVTDIWFPGIEMIRYMETLYGLTVKIYGIWHAGSITYMDFAQPMNSWARYFEMGWLRMCDGIFVGSGYAKDSLVQKLLKPFGREGLERRIHCIGMPLDAGYIYSITKDIPKQDAIIFPNRFDLEKGIPDFLDVIEMLYNEGWKTKTIFTTSREKFVSNAPFYLKKLENLVNRYPELIEVKENLSREEYLKTMASCKAMVSTTYEENFGYCLVEALASGTVPLIKNDFSHVEIVEGNEKMLYNTLEDLCKRLIDIPEIDRGVLFSLVETYDLVIEHWIEKIIYPRAEHE